MILVSACLMGENCKYHGGNNFSSAVAEYLADKEYIIFCPEVAGGLPVPRPPVERLGTRAINKEGTDVTAEFNTGAAAALALCHEFDIKLAILKEGSPTCGVHLIYDGSFSGVKIPGMGMTSELLAANGIQVISEDDL